MTFDSSNMWCSHVQAASSLFSTIGCAHTPFHSDARRNVVPSDYYCHCWAQDVDDQRPRSDIDGKVLANLQHQAQPSPSTDPLRRPTLPQRLQPLRLPHRTRPELQRRSPGYRQDITLPRLQPRCRLSCDRRRQCTRAADSKTAKRQEHRSQMARNAEHAQ